MFFRLRGLTQRNGVLKGCVEVSGFGLGVLMMIEWRLGVYGSVSTGETTREYCFKLFLCA